MTMKATESLTPKRGTQLAILQPSTENGGAACGSAPLSDEEKKKAVEAVLFAAGFAVPYAKLAELFGESTGQIKKFISRFAEEYNAEQRGILLLVMEEACQLCTKAEYKDYIREALGIKLSGKLSASCLEVLAIIAYHQPVTKAFVEQVRGVDCSYALSALCDKNLVTQQGRLDAPGKPILYGTTDDFLRCFGLSSLAELPEQELSQKCAPVLPDSAAEERAEPSPSAQ